MLTFYPFYFVLFIPAYAHFLFSLILTFHVSSTSQTHVRTLSNSILTRVLLGCLASGVASAAAARGTVLTNCSEILRKTFPLLCQALSPQ